MFQTANEFVIYLIHNRDSAKVLELNHKNRLLPRSIFSDQNSVVQTAKYLSKVRISSSNLHYLLVCNYESAYLHNETQLLHFIVPLRMIAG